MRHYLLPLLLILCSFVPVSHDPPVQVHQFQSDTQYQSVAWWLPPWFPLPFPQVAIHYVEVPAPDFDIRRLEISFEDELQTFYHVANTNHQIPLDVRVFTTTNYTSVKLRDTDRLGHAQTSLGNYEVTGLSHFDGFHATDRQSNSCFVTCVVDNPDIINMVNNSEDTVILKIRSFSTYNINSNHQNFLHKLNTRTQVFGEVTYHIQ